MVYNFTKQGEIMKTKVFKEPSKTEEAETNKQNNISLRKAKKEIEQMLKSK